MAYRFLYSLGIAIGLTSVGLHAAPSVRAACVHEPIVHRLAPLARLWVWDLVYLYKNMISEETLKIGIGTIPVYGLTTVLDDKISDCFYDKKTHTNTHQMHDTVNEALEKSVFFALLGFGVGSLFSSSERQQTIGRVSLIGQMTSLLIKDIIKISEHRINCRPPNAHFEQHKKYYSGFPSGHMMQATFMTSFLGLLYGARAYVPLTIYSCALFGSLVNSNRHYASQVIAGASLGLIYGFAASKTVSDHLERYNCDISASLSCSGGRQSLTLAFNW